MIKEQEQYEDVLAYSPAVIKIIKDDHELRKIWDPVYGKILKFVTNKPATIKGITEFYNKVAHESKQKSEQTLYRYVKTLEKMGLIIRAGQRVILKKTVSEILYGSSALLYYYIYSEADDDFEEKIGELTSGSNFIVQSYYKVPHEEKPHLKTMYNDIFPDLLTSVEKMLTNGGEEIRKIFSEFDWKQTRELLDILKAVLIAKDKRLQEKILTAFGLNN